MQIIGDQRQLDEQTTIHRHPAHVFARTRLSGDTFESIARALARAVFSFVIRTIRREARVSRPFHIHRCRGAFTTAGLTEVLGVSQ
jgi:hypothetical protein